MSGYFLSEDADLDLDDIWEYIAQDNIAPTAGSASCSMRLNPSGGRRASATGARTLPTIRRYFFR
jgi:plasmid stabilization system protein ParE